MLYRRLGKTDWQVSAIGQGCWNIGNQWGEMSDQDADRILRTAVEHGINLFDTAESYGVPNGLSELRLGKTLKSLARDELFIVSKIGNWGKRTGQGVPKTTADMIRVCGHASAGRMGIGHVDVMLCHEDDIEDPSVYIQGFRELRGEGFIREYGISTNKLPVLRKFMEMSNGECAVVELEYSLLNTAPEAELLPYCREHDLGILVRGPLAKGMLSGRFDQATVFTDDVRQGWNEGGRQRASYLSQLDLVERLKRQVGSGDLPATALRYVLSHPSAPVAIPGATNPRQVVANAEAGAGILDGDAVEQLRTAAGGS